MCALEPVAKTIAAAMLGVRGEPIVWTRRGANASKPYKPPPPAMQRLV